MSEIKVPFKDELLHAGETAAGLGALFFGAFTLLKGLGAEVLSTTSVETTLLATIFFWLTKAYLNNKQLETQL